MMGSILRLLRGLSRQRVPVVRQVQAADCGAACLTMVLRYHERNTSLSEVRRQLGVRPLGTSVSAVADAARNLGLRARAVHVEDASECEHLACGTILHWKGSHFVVFERRDHRGFWVVDPGVGRQRISGAEFHESFGGTAIELAPGTLGRPQKAPRGRVWDYVDAILERRDLLVRIILASAIAQVVGLALPILTGLIVDRVVPRRELDLLTVVAFGVAGLTIFGFALSIVRAYLLLHLRTTLDMRITGDFVSHLLHLPFSYFETRHTGDLLQRLSSNARIREVLTSVAMSAILDGILVTSYLVILLVTHWRLGLVVIVLGALRVAIYVATRARYRELMAEALAAQAEASTYQVQMLEGIETLKASGHENNAVGLWADRYLDVMNVAVAQGRLSGVVDASLGALGRASPLVLLTFGAHLVIAGELSLGTMLAMNALAGGFLAPLSNLVSAALQLQTMGSVVERVDDVWSTTPEASARGPVPAISGRVRLMNVEFRYREDAPPAVKDVSLECAIGESLAVVGESGAGKSTLARLLVGLYLPTSGSVRYDEVATDEPGIASIRQQIGYVPQVPSLVGGTLRSSITLGDGAVSMEEVRRAARLAEIDDVIEALPMKYDTVVGPAGGGLSGGERQRVAIARALVRRPKILVMDEATSQLDRLIESRIQSNVRALGVTLIVVAHRLSSVAESDRIVVLQSGRVVEEGGHDELLRAGGQYARLVLARRGGSE